MSSYDDAFKAAMGGGVAPQQSPYDGVAAQVFATLGQASPTQPAPKAEPVSDFTGNLRFATPFGTLNTGIPLPQAVNRALAQVGSGISDYGYSTASREKVDQKRELDAPLKDMPGGTTFNVLGKAAPLVAMPQVGGPVLGGIAAGVASGALEPVGTGDSRATNMAFGGVAGGALPLGVQWLRNAIRPDAARAALANSALRQGIPIGPADITQNSLVRATRSVLNDVPVVGSPGQSQAVAKQLGFNRAVSNVIGENTDNLGPEAMKAAKSRIGGELNRIWNNNTLKVDEKFSSEFQSIIKRAQDNLNKDQVELVLKQARQLTNSINNGEIPGGFANNWQSTLRRAAEGQKGLTQDILNDLRQSTIRAFNRSVTGADAAALTKARSQYGAYKTLEPLMDSAEAGLAGRPIGDVPAALLPGAIVKSYGSASRSPFGDLSQIGSQFVADRVARTGGSPRAIVQNMLVGSGLLGSAGTAAGVASGVGLLPSAAVGVPLGIGLGFGVNKALGSPALARAVLQPTVQRGLLNGPSMRSATREAAANLLYRSPLLLPGALFPASAPLE